MSVLLTAILIFISAFCSGPSIRAYAAADQTGTISVSGYLNVRSGAGTTYSIIGKLYNGDKVGILSKHNDSDGATWYRVSYGQSSTGYIHSKYVTIDEVLPEYTPDADFEAYLTEQKFPDSYKQYLRTLHAQYPNWVFVADHLEMTWAKALAEESKLGRNLISSSSPNAWKSMEPGAYDWKNNKWIGFDGSSWVAAAGGIIAYYMDPRNFLNSTDVFQFLSHNYYSQYQTVDALKKMVAGSFLANNFPETGYATYSDALIAAAAQSKVNPYVLASMILVEQGTKGTGKSISGTVKGYEGYYNFFNIRAYAYGGYDAVQYGLLYAKGSGSYGRPWDSRFKSIVGGATYYGNNYVNLGQDTLYYKKFNVVNKSSGLYSHQYMTNIQGAALEGTKLAKAYQDVSSTTLVFSIPVYQSMPAAVAQKPATEGDNNNFLSSLSVTGFNLTPSFAYNTTVYELIVPAETSSITVNAKPLSSSAKVSGAGTVVLSSSSTNIVVKVTSTSGEVRDYTIAVSRMGESSEIKTPSISTKYSMTDKYISGIAPGTTAEAFENAIAVENGSKKLLEPSGANLIGTVGTGDIITVLNSQNVLHLSRKIVIYGDVNGDGKISIVDLAQVQKHILKLSTLTDAYLAAADVNRDGKVSILDLAKIQKHILNLETIKQ